MRIRKSFLAAFCVAASAFAAAPPGGMPVIGLASTEGSFSINSSPVKGAAELVDGTTLQTADSPGNINLENGVALRLATRSSGKIYSDHMLLERGSATVGNFGGFTVNAGQLQIVSEGQGTEAVVRLTKKTIEVASIGGSVAVSEGGAMLTRLAAGTKMSFQQSGASSAQPAQTGAAPAPRGPADKKTFVWAIGITSAAALAIGLLAAAQGKSPF